MKKRGTKKTLAKGLTKGLGKANSNPSNQDKIKAKNESNIGDQRGAHDIQTALKYFSNSKKARTSKNEKKILERKLFYQSREQIKKTNSEISEKQLLSELQKVFKVNGFTLSRSKYFRFKAWPKSNFKKKKSSQLFEADQRRRITEEQLKAKTAHLKPATSEDLISFIKTEIQPSIEKHLEKKSASIKEGRKRGSIKGGNTNRKNWENFI